jgi:hypothetical protein
VLGNLYRVQSVVATDGLVLVGVYIVAAISATVVPQSLIYVSLQHECGEVSKVPLRLSSMLLAKEKRSLK